MAYEVFETCLLVPGFNRGECASWVQAIGSVLAILVAVLVARHQSRRMEQAIHDEECRRVEAKFAPAIAIIEKAIEELRSTYIDALSSRSESSFGVGPEFVERHRWFAEAFSKIEAHTMPSGDSVKYVMRVQELFRQADRVMGDTSFRLNQLIEIRPEHRAELDQLLRGLESCLSFLRWEVERLTIITTAKSRLRAMVLPRK